MRLLWLLVAVVTGVNAEEYQTCRITGDPHVTTFDPNLLTGALINYPCQYRAAVMCLMDGNQNCRKTLSIHAINGETNGRGNSFVSRVVGFVELTQTGASATFTLDADKIWNNEDPWDAGTQPEDRNLLCIDYIDRYTAHVSFDAEGECLPVFTFHVRGGGGLPGLVITSGPSVIPDPQSVFMFPGTLCGHLSEPTFPDFPDGLTTLKQQILYGLVKQEDQQDDEHCDRVVDKFSLCSEEDGAVAVQQCEPYTRSTNVVCYKTHGHTTAPEVLGYCFQHHCAQTQAELEEVQNWLNALPQVPECPISFA